MYSCKPSVTSPFNIACSQRYPNTANSATTSLAAISAHWSIRRSLTPPHTEQAYCLQYHERLQRQLFHSWGCAGSPLDLLLLQFVTTCHQIEHLHSGRPVNHEDSDQSLQ